MRKTCVCGPRTKSATWEINEVSHRENKNENATTRQDDHRLTFKKEVPIYSGLRGLPSTAEHPPEGLLLYILRGARLDVPHSKRDVPVCNHYDFVLDQDRAVVVVGFVVQACVLHDAIDESCRKSRARGTVYSSSEIGRQPDGQIRRRRLYSQVKFRSWEVATLSVRALSFGVTDGEQGSNARL